jgi:hypothetical protein
MNTGTEPPQWAKDLLYKWVELDDKFYGAKHNVFIFYSDEFSYAPIECRVRIFAELEKSARDSLTGTREPGLFATYIEPDGYRVIDAPAGLEQWTEDYIKQDKELLWQ